MHAWLRQWPINEKNNLCLCFLSIDRTLEFATYLHLNAPFQTDINNDRICAKRHVKSEIFPIVLLLVLGLIYIGISPAVVVLDYEQKGIFYLFTFLCTTGADPGFF